MSNTWMILLIGLIPVVIVIIIVLYLMKKIKYKGNLRLNKMIIAIYVGILITSVVVYEVLPKEPMLERLSLGELKQLQTENKSFEATLLKQEENKLSQKFLKDEWSHELSGNTLSLGYIGNDPYSTRVVVEWIDSTDQTIEGKEYRSHINVYGIEIEDRIPLHEVGWNGNQLVIHEPSEQQLTFEQFSNDLNLLPQKVETEEIRMVRGQTYIHLKVPKHIEIVDPLGLQIY
ncbi:hypothetical protein KD050_08015 [Psychrobacillus sp. INOP01]|uniref:hypothetical protein n=1 Tax=Psychrobacillus sp. INOP01 TaxID=2829187 RepID=UPI001BAA42FC|nr:hypothetical protein [Psychrobacillus sp. INOP01]QUG43166.1 hypothetical protein KD050_08015 [Psychrobacillus sp. INOP01]